MRDSFLIVSTVEDGSNQMSQPWFCISSLITYHALFCCFRG